MSKRASNDNHEDDQSDNDNNDKEARDVRAALQMAVCQIIVKEDRVNRTRTTSEAIRALTELVYQYAIHRLAPDLYQFSNHANRKSTIAVDDVALILRKVPHLQEQLMDNLDIKRAPSTSNKETSSRRTSTGSEPNPNRSIDKLLSSSDDDSSIDIVTNKKDTPRPIAVPRARVAVPTSTESANTKSKTLNLKRPPTYSQNKRRIDELLNDSSSDDELPDFMKPKRKSTTPTKGEDSPLLPPPPKRPSPPKQAYSHQSQVMDILNNYSSDSGLSHAPEDELPSSPPPPDRSKSKFSDDDDDSII